MVSAQVNNKVARGQAELVSTVIMVGLALVIALGIVYYFTPLITRVSVSGQLKATLASAGASIDSSVVVLDSSSLGTKTVVIVRNVGDTRWRACLSVIAFNEDGLPVESVDSVYYLFEGSPAWINTTSGWVSLAQLASQGGDFTIYNEPSEYVYMLFPSEHISLSSLSSFTSSVVEIACLDVLDPGSTRIVRVDLPVNIAAQGGRVYSLVVLVVIDNLFYEVKRIPLG